MKKLIAGLSIAALVLAFLPVSAATIDGVSDESTATSSASWLIKLLMRNHNGAGITNNVTSSASSGGNTFTSADDQAQTTIVTGGASSATLVENTANTNMVSEQYESADGADNAISNIVDSSEATTESDDTLDNDIENLNEVEVTNEIDSTSDTGSNMVTSGDSLTGASATTGAAEALTGAVNNFNTNIKEVIRTIRSRVR